MNERMVQPVAFTLRPERLDTPLPLVGMEFPEAWKPLIHGLAQEASGRKEKPVTIPVVSLKGVMGALVPHLAATPLREKMEPGGRERRESPPWLIAHSPACHHAIWAIFQAWLEVHFGQCDGFEAVRNALTPDALSFRTALGDLRVAVEPNGTSKPATHYYNVVPAWLAERLVEQGVSIPVKGHPVPLVRVPCDRGAELVTWPPVWHETKRGPGAYSHTVRITVQTHVGCAVPRIHFHYGVRRWVVWSMWDGGKVKLGRNAKTVYLRVPAGWLDLPPAGSFTLAHLKARGSNGSRDLEWEDTVPAIAKRLGVAFPEAVGFAAEPGKWMQPGGVLGIEAAAVEKTPRWHAVQPGLGLDDHEYITRHLAAHLTEEIVLCEPMRRVATSNKTRKHPLVGDVRAIPAGERLAALAASVGPKITIEVLYRTELFRDMQVDRLRNLLLGDPPPPLARGEKRPEFVPAPAPEVQEIPMGDGIVRILCRPIGKCGAPLPPMGESERVTDYRPRATLQRIDQIQSSWDRGDGPALALVDLPNYSGRSDRQMARYRDPKLAIRLGLARLGKLSKFVDGEAGELAQRCEGAAREALRQLGFLPAPIGFTLARSSRQLPERLLVAAVWMHRLNRANGHFAVLLPVVTFLEAGSHRVLAWIPDGKPIRPYWQAQLDIVRMDPEMIRRQKQPEQIKMLRRLLLHDLPREGWSDILVLCEAQNSRPTWKGLANSQVELGKFVFDAVTPPGGGEHHGAVMRLIRLRTSESNETPEWFTDGAGPNIGYTQGLWQDPGVPNHYFCIGEKPAAMRRKRKGKQVDPGEMYAQPSILEILPIVSDPRRDDPQVWAQAVYEWKQMAGVVTNSGTLRPIPLEFARHTDRYARTIAPFIDASRWEEGDESDELDE